MSDIDLDAVEARCRDWRDYQVVSDIDLDAMDTRARTTAHFSPAPGPIALANDVLALIAHVREQEQEIARLRSALEEQQQRAMGQLWAHDQELADLARKKGASEESVRKWLAATRYGSPDDLDRPVTQRQFLEVLAYLSANGERYAYDHFAVQWRQEARAHALTQVDHGQEHPTREDR